MLTATNPFTGQTIDQYPTLNEEQLDRKIKDAHQAFQSWKSTTFAERAQVLKAVAVQLRKQKEELANLMAEEMGKPVKEGGPEVEKGAWCAEHYADNAERYLADEVLASDASLSYVRYQPLGTLLGILPWNAPVWLAFRYLAPALMAGNTCVMKHDPNVPASARAIADAFKKANAPANVVVNLPLKNDQVEAAIRHPNISAVSFTGSSFAGAKVAAIAASEIKPAVLELGGSDPCIVMADADLEKAADIAVLSRIINAGQSCIAAKRIIIEQTIYDEFIAMLKVRLAKLKLGDPKSAETDIGPLAREDLRKNLHSQVTDSIQAGATCLMGGKLPEGPGYFYPVTLLSDVSISMPVFCQETFGPVMVVKFAADEQ